MRTNHCVVASTHDKRLSTIKLVMAAAESTPESVASYERGNERASAEVWCVCVERSGARRIIRPRRDWTTSRPMSPVRGD